MCLSRFYFSASETVQLGNLHQLLSALQLRRVRRRRNCVESDDSDSRTVDSSGITINAVSTADVLSVASRIIRYEDDFSRLLRCVKSCRSLTTSLRQRVVGRYL